MTFAYIMINFYSQSAAHTVGIPDPDVPGLLDLSPTRRDSDVKQQVNIFNYLFGYQCSVITVD